MEETLRKSLLEMVFTEMVNVSKMSYIGGLISIEAVIKTLQNVVAISDFYKIYRDRLVEVGVRLLTHLEPEFKLASTGSINAEELAMR